MHFTRLLLKKCVNNVLFLIPFKEPQLHIMLHLEKTTANYNYSFIWEAVISCYPSFFNIFISSEDKNNFKANILIDRILLSVFLELTSLSKLCLFNDDDHDDKTSPWPRHAIRPCLSTPRQTYICLLTKRQTWGKYIATVKASIIIVCPYT